MRRELTEEAGDKSQITAEISWLRMGDIFAGKVNQIWVNATNCILNDLRYSKLFIDSQGFWFDLPKLLTAKQLQIIKMEPTQIIGVIDEAALNEYLDLRYPEFNSNLRIKKGGLILSGWAYIFKNHVSIELEGDLRAISEKQLRFYPTRLLIADQKVSGTLLRIVSEQLPIEFGIMEGWPLKISSLSLDEKKIKVTMEDIKTSSR